MNMASSPNFKSVALLSVMCKLNQDSSEEKIAFPNYGNGILLYTIEANSGFYIEISQSEEEGVKESSILLEVLSDKAAFLAQTRGNTEKPKHLKKVDNLSSGKSVGYDSDERVTYWWSYDSNAMTIKYGKGYYMEETTLLTYTFEDKGGNEENRNNYFLPTKPKTVCIHDKYPWTKHRQGQISQVALRSNPSVIDVQRNIAFSLHPLTSNRPAIVRDSSVSTLVDIDKGKYTYSSSLPEACQVLYANVTGEYMSLDNEEQPYKFTDAIRHSIEAEDGILYKLIDEKKKEGQFGSEDEVYLRVTVGKNLGNSPGTPYVLEIWPKKCGSPIHNHGNACAVIRVLHGGLNISIFNKKAIDSRDSECLMSFDVTKDDVTWISPNWYQTHQLYNNTNDYCATIQCYQYGDADEIHWPYFDYLDEECGCTDNFVPDSDFEFTDMYEKVMKEYEDYMENKKTPKSSKNLKRKRKN